MYSCFSFFSSFLQMRISKPFQVYRGKFHGGGLKVLARGFKPKSHGYHEALRTTKLTPWGYIMILLI